MPWTKSEAAQLAKLLISAYPNSRATEPEYYIAQVVTVFLNWPQALIEKAVSPSGIAYDYPTFLPTIGEINRWLEKRMAHLERIHGQQALPPPNYPPASEHLKALGKAWLDRSDPKVRELLGESFRNREKIVEEARKRLVGQIGEVAFERLPDQP